MTYPAKRLYAVLLIVGLGACENSDTSPRDGERVAIRLGAAGGQTGGEGSCEGTTLSELPFTLEQAETLVFGTRETTIGAYASGASAPLRVRVEPNGNGEEVKACGAPQLRQPVEVTLSFEEPALDLTFDSVVSIITADFAILERRLPGEVAEQLGFTGESSYPRDDGNKASLTLVFGVDGVRGAIRPDSHCQALAIPAERRCLHVGSVELPLSADEEAALARIAGLGPLQHEWEDGTRTELSIELDGAPQFVCSGALSVVFPDDGRRNIIVRTRVRSADGRLDLSVPGFVDPAFGTANDWFLLLSGLYPAGALPDGQVLDIARTPSQLARVELSVRQREGMPANADVTVAAHDPKPGAPTLTEPIDAYEGSSTDACYIEL